MIYPSPNGFTQGTHTWSVSYTKGERSVRSIGVTTLNMQWISKGLGRYNWTTGSYYDGTGASWNRVSDWRIGDIITVSVNIDAGIVDYYRNDTKFKTDHIFDRDNPLYFAICVDPDRRCGVMQSVLKY